MIQTTAQFRAQAQQAERELDWQHAAYYWACAIEAYPDARGALAQRDLAKMTAQRDAARKAAARDAGPTAPGPEHY